MPPFEERQKNLNALLNSRVITFRLTDLVVSPRLCAFIVATIPQRIIILPTTLLMNTHKTSYFIITHKSCRNKKSTVGL